MIFTETISKTREIIAEAKKEGKTVGFVPTMGALHEGHLALVRNAAKENDFVVVSIFVNPIQFNNKEDLEKYPRTFKEDKMLLEMNNCDLLFHPTVKEMYPEEAKEKFDFGKLDKVLEGKYRPGHFNGVAVVVKRLLQIVEPHKAYFGEKDYQQLLIVKSLVEMEQLQVDIIASPTLREADGLAMSSRNRRLTDEERKFAPLIHNTLSKAAGMVHEKKPEEIRNWVQKQINNYNAFNVEYFEIADGETLEPVNEWTEDRKYVMLIAAHLGKVRLIDNVIINS